MQIKALKDVISMKNIKELRSLNEKVAAQSWYISWGIDKCIPFFNALKKEKRTSSGGKNVVRCSRNYWIIWKLPRVLFKPSEGEDLYFYLAMSPYAQSEVLVREEIYKGRFTTLASGSRVWKETIQSRKSSLITC